MLDSIPDIGNPNYRGQIKMAAYLIADIEVTNPEGFKKYQEAVPVSYTHLRAHETREDLVCRLLLEKKK